MISCLMSLYNESEEEIRQAVNSVLAQTFSDLELIIVVDNPQNDKLIDLARNIQSTDSRVRVLINKKNIGLAKSMNKALEISCGDYIARMDADDIAFENRFKEQLDYMLNHGDVDAVTSNCVCIDENGNETHMTHMMIEDQQLLCKILLRQNILIHPTAFFKTSVLKEVGGYRDFKAAQDVDLWLRMLKSGYKISIIEKPLLYYRIRENSISKSKNARQVAYGILARTSYKKNWDMIEITDSFATDYFKKIHLYSKEDEEAFYSCMKKATSGIDEIKSRHIIRGLIHVLCAITKNKATFIRMKANIEMNLIAKYKLSNKKRKISY